MEIRVEASGLGAFGFWLAELGVEKAISGAGLLFFFFFLGGGGGGEGRAESPTAIEKSET